MKRHTDNKSYYSQSEKIVFWTLEIKIILSLNGELQKEVHTITLHDQINENYTINTIIQNF